MKVRFNKEARVDDEVAFKENTTHDLTEASAMRWVRRGYATLVEEGKISEMAHKAGDKIKDALHNVAQKIDGVATKGPEFENEENTERKDIQASASQANTQVTSPQSEVATEEVAKGVEEQKENTKDAVEQEAVANKALAEENKKAKPQANNKSVKGL